MQMLIGNFVQPVISITAQKYTNRPFESSVARSPPLPVLKPLLGFQALKHPLGLSGCFST